VRRPGARYFIPVVEDDRDRGSRSGQAPRSTAARSASSRLAGNVSDVVPQRIAQELSIAGDCLPRDELDGIVRLVRETHRDVSIAFQITVDLDGDVQRAARLRARDDLAPHRHECEHQ